MYVLMLLSTLSSGWSTKLHLKVGSVQISKYSPHGPDISSSIIKFSLSYIHFTEIGTRTICYIIYILGIKTGLWFMFPKFVIIIFSHISRFSPLIFNQSVIVYDFVIIISSWSDFVNIQYYSNPIPFPQVWSHLKMPDSFY